MLAAVVLVGGGGVLVGAVVAVTTGHFTILCQQLVCLVGQASLPVNDTARFLLSNALQVLFLFSLMSMQDLLIETT